MKKSKQVIQLFGLLIIVILSALSVAQASVPEGWGAGWSEIRILDEVSHYSLSPQVVKDSQGMMHLFWLKNIEQIDQICYLKMTQDGEIATPITQLTDFTQWKVRNFKAIIDSENKIHLFLEMLNNGLFEIRYFQYSTMGKTEMTRTLFSTNRPLQGLTVRLDQDDNLCLIWASLETSNYEIYYSKYSPELELLVEPVNLSNSREVSLSPNFALDLDKRIHLIWNEYDGAKWTLKYQVFSSQGRKVIENLSLGKSIDYQNQTTPQVAVDSEGHVHLAWIHGSKGGFGIVDYHLYYATLDDKQSWLVDEMQISDHQNLYKQVVGVHMTIDQQDKVHFVWTDNLYGPLTNLYAVVDEGKIVYPQTRLAVTSEGIWLPNFHIDADDQKHLFFLQFATEGQSNLVYMNTLNSARLNYLNRIGIDVDHLFISFFYRLVSLLFYSGLGIILNFLPLAFAFLAVLLLERFFGQMSFANKLLLMIALLLLFLTSGFASLPESFSGLYELMAICLSIVVIFLFTKIVKMNWKDHMVFLLLEVLWFYTFIFLLQIPVGYQLLG